MNRKIIALMSVFAIFAVLFSSISYAGTSSLGSGGSSFTSFDVSIDRVRANSKVLAESNKNLLPDADVYSLIVDFTAVQTLENAHVQATLRGRASSDVVSDATDVFDVVRNESGSKSLTLTLTDGLKREKDFDLTVKIFDARGRSTQKTYGITNQRSAFTSNGGLDVSIDRVKVNNNVVASGSNFIDKNTKFSTVVEFTALEDLTNAHVEAVIKDLNSGTIVADASPNFNLAQDASSSKSLSITLLNNMRHSDSFDLTVKIIDAEGHSKEKSYGLRMKNSNGGSDGRALDLSIDSVEVDNDFVAENENNFITITPGKKNLGVNVRITSLENIQKAHVDAVLAFENGDVVSDATSVFDIAKDVTRVQGLQLPLVSSFEQNNFKLKIRVVNADGDSIEKIYGLKISQQKFPFVVTSIALNPDNSIDAGKNLIATFSFKNSGVVPLEGIIAKVSIPELGISSIKYVDQLKDSSSPEVRSDFILKIPDNAQTGTYTVRGEIVSQFSGESEVREIPISVRGTDEQPIQNLNDKLIISIGVAKQDVYEDREVSYPITLANQGPLANRYTLMLDGAGWANLRLAEPNTFVLKPKESKTINIYASSKGTSSGEQIFLVSVKSGDTILKQVPLKGNAANSGKGTLGEILKNILEFTLIAATIFLVAFGLFFGVRKYMQKGNGEPTEQYIGDAADDVEAYY